MITTVLTVAVVQGTVLTASVLQTQEATHTFTGQVQLATSDLADPKLYVVLTLQMSLDPLVWRPVAVSEWQGGQGTQPTVTWTGAARRARLLIDISRPASAGATITIA